MRSFEVLLTLALGIVAFGFYTLLRASRSVRAAGEAWYSIESRQLKRTGRSLGFQAAVLLIAGAILLLWLLFYLSELAAVEPTLSPPAAPSTSFTPSPTAKATPTTVLIPTATAGDSSPASPAGDADETPLVTIPTVPMTSQAVVTNTGGGGLWLRDKPFGDGIVLLPENSTVFVLGGLVDVEGLLWQSVVDADGHEGWVAADYLLYR